MVTLTKQLFMEPVEYFVEAVGEQLIINVPQNLQGKRLKVLLIDSEEEDVEKFHEMSVEERLKILKEVAGTAKYPDFPISKYDVYDQ